MVKNRIDRAIADLENSLEKSMSESEGDKKLRRVLRNKKAFDKAVRNYQKILTTQPGYRLDALNIERYEPARSVLVDYTEFMTNLNWRE